MSWAPEVQTGNDPKWYGNALRFATEEEAKLNVQELMSRWTAVRATRVVESKDPVNYRWVDGRLVEVAKSVSKSQAKRLAHQRGELKIDVMKLPEKE